MPPDPGLPLDESGRRHRAAEIFADALETSPDARSEFLRVACGDDERLRQEVHTLLRAMPEAGNWFDRALDGEADATQALPQAADPTGRIVSHYRLEGFLGAGGMGEVYRATDVALGRAAALKLLRPGVSAEIRDRLVQEARTHARFSHPGIAQLFDSGVSDGVDFLAMEYVEGETLRARLRRGPLPSDEALSITASVLEALVHAHSARFLHRDIKPENVMLTAEGGAKLLDFGIAKEIGVVKEEATQALTAIAPALTMHGMIVGTPGYMSPEQLRGDAVDERTDVFSVGAILHEMLSGEPAFPGRNAAEKAQSTLSRELPPVRGKKTPPGIDGILQRAVARDAVDRYSSASALLSELRRAATGQVVAVLPNTLAVMDLANLRGDEEDAWIGSGVGESLAVDLRRAEGLDLVPRNKVVKLQAKLAAQGQGGDPVALGLAAGCRWVLTGSFQRMGKSLRLTMQLVEVATGKDLWTEKLDGSVEDVFGMQDRLATLTAESLSAVLPEQGEETAAPAMDVMEHYERARKLFLTMDPSATEQGREHLEQALELDPEFAPALAWMASVYAPMRWNASGDPEDLEMALKFAGRAIAADPELAEGHLWTGYAVWRQGRPDPALEALECADRLDPTSFFPRYFIGAVLCEQGRWTEAAASLRQAAERQPKVPFVLQLLANAIMELGDLDAALWTITQACEAEQDPESPGWAGAGALLVHVLRRQGRQEEARSACMDHLDRIEKSSAFTRSLYRPFLLRELGCVCLELGDIEAATVAFEQCVAQCRDRRNMGHPLVQGLAGLAQAKSDGQAFEEALEIFGRRTDYQFPFGGLHSDVYTLLELARAARALGREEQAQDLYRRAREAGLNDDVE